MFGHASRNASTSSIKQIVSSSSRHYSSPPHFYSNKQLELLASKRANRLSLRQLVFFGRSMTEERLIKSANYVRTELPVRIAHRIRDMQSLPFSVVTEENVAKIYALYWDAFEKLRNYPQVVTRQDNDKFCKFLRTILGEHAAAIPILSLGLSIASPHLSSEELDSFMRRMLVSRISRRVLAEHHLALSQSLLEQERSPDGGGHVGIIFTGLSVKRSIDKFINLLLNSDSMPERLRQALPLGAFKLPEIQVDGQVDASFSYIREHLEYIILELFLNAIRATATQMHSNPETVPGVIRATISSDEDDVYVRISDQGGGLMLQESQTPSDLFSFSHHRNNTRLNDDRLGALQHFSRRKGGLRGTVDETIANPGLTSQRLDSAEVISEIVAPRQMGIGLPLSNIYATYFGGTLELMSMDGWGTDVYLKLPRLGTNLEGIEV
ncbi:hypothetical protein M408DRAFT_331297 [Serendipita vermifera MAFF 305830]|uniref:Protein-serine/threonine kinase n=1 Tax=Serendipita vermifera MAFF 305830 TaxID=933852 RepID=A0A0C3AYZ9_SERVB|nr:hypothetical protein M408DRAFT_331297 [Serendipita vermifera MAFF 305830]